MNDNRTLIATLVGAALLAGCNTLPADNARLNQARSDYRVAQDTPVVRDLAGNELKQAGDTLEQANAAWTRGDDAATVDHLAYLAGQRVAIAQETAQQKAAERAVGNAETLRDQVRLAARTDEADRAQRGADTARREAAASQRDAAASQRAAGDAEARTRLLESQLAELNAKQTERGLVITIGDVFFDTDQARLKPTGQRSVEQLAGFLNEHPRRNALIEGFTDSTGSAAHNQALSQRRADAVRAALLGQGIGRERIAAQGHGEAYPVASNDTSGGRQLNRRVEIVLSDDGGIIPAR